MPESPDLVRSALTPLARTVGGILVACLMLGSLLTSVYQVRRSVNSEAKGEYTEIKVISGHDILCPTGLSLSTQSVWLLWLILPGWTVLLCSTVAVILLIIGRGEGAIISWVIAQLTLLLLIVFRGFAGMVGEAIASILSPSSEFQWGDSIPLWIVGQGLLLGLSWRGTRAASSSNDPSQID